MADFEVHLSIVGDETRLIGRARANRARGKETVLFDYADAWLHDAEGAENSVWLDSNRALRRPPLPHQNRRCET